MAFVSTVRISSDLAMGCSSIRHSAALRILDHHLHTTGLLPRPSASEGVDIYCVGQAVTTFPHHSVLLDELHNPRNHAATKSHVWVARAGQGSSITFGGAVTLNDLVLTTCSRVFVRVDLESGRPMRVTKEESSSIFAVDSDWNGVGRFGLSIPRVDQINTGHDILSGSARSLAGDEVLCASVGPQHINHGDHVDHAFLAETASHALFLGCPEMSNLAYGADAESSTLLVQYLAPGRLGQELRCHVKDRKLASVWGDDGAGEWQLLVMAKQTMSKANGK
jgi:hypothetical protein